MPTVLSTLVTSPADTVDSVASAVSSLSVSEDSDGSSSSGSPSSRQSYSLLFKKQFILKVDNLRQKHPSLSIRTICAMNDVPNNYYARWKKDVEKAQTLSLDPDSRLHITNSTRKMHAGRISILEPHAKAITQVVRDLRDRALPVSTTRVRIEASKVCSAFKTKTSIAKKQIVRWL